MVVQYTLAKPFPGRPSCDDQDCILADIEREYAVSQDSGV